MKGKLAVLCFLVMTACGAAQTGGMLLLESGGGSRTVVTPPENVANFVATAGDTLNTLSWSTSSGATSYVVYWSTSPGVDDEDTAISGLTGNSYQHTSLTNGVPIYYAMVAVSGGGVSALSAERSATPFTPGGGDTGLVLYVDPDDGNDSNDGTIALPKRTLPGVQTAIRIATGRTSVGGEIAEPVTVYLRGGVYLLTETFTLDSRDGGSSGVPVRYAAYNGETVVMTAAKLVTPSNWDVVTSGADGYSQMDASYRTSMYQLNLTTVTGLDASTISDNGSVWLPDYAMLIVGDQIKMMSRYPAGEDETEAAWTPVVGWTDLVPDPNSVVGWGEATQIQAGDTVIGGWNLTNQDIFVMGRLGNESWSQYWQTVTALGTSGGNSTINFALNASGSVVTNGINGYYTFFAMRNMLNVVNKGEFVHRRPTGYMTYRPTDAEATAWSDDGTRPATYITNLQSVMTIGSLAAGVSSNPANYISFEGIIFEGARNWAVNVFGATGVSFLDCTNRNNGWGGWNVEDVTDFTIDGGETKWCMQTGGAIEGGDKATLTDGNIVIQNHRFEEIGANLNGNIVQALSFSNVAKTETACGVLLDNVDFYRTRDVAVALCANSIMRNCVVDRAMMVTGDRGAVETCGNQFPNYQYSNINVLMEDNIIQNTIQHPRYNNSSRSASFGLYPESVAYWTVQDNQFIDNTNGMNWPAGKKNIIRRNKMTNCHSGHYRASFVFGGRVSYIQNETSLPIDLANFNVQAEPWLTAAPRLKDYRGMRRATASASADTLTSMALGSARVHNFANGETIKAIYWPSGFGGLSGGTTYYVRDATTFTFKLAATEGGAAINITSDGTDGWFGKPENAVICYHQEYTVVDNWQNAGVVVAKTSGMFRQTSGSEWATEDGFQVGVDPTQLNYQIGASLAGSGDLPAEGGGTVAISALDYEWP